MKYLSFSFPVLFLHSEEETVVMNILSTVYQKIPLDCDRVLQVSTVAGNVLSYNGKFLALCDVPERAIMLSQSRDHEIAAGTLPGNGEVLKIFDLSPLLFPPLSSDNNEDENDELDNSFEVKTLSAELEDGDLVTGLHWRPVEGKAEVDVLAVVFQTGCVVVYEIFSERDAADDEIVEQAIRAALSAGVVDQKQLPRRVNRFLPQISLMKAIHAPSLFSPPNELVVGLPLGQPNTVAGTQHPQQRTLFAWVREKSSLANQFDVDDENAFLSSSTSSTTSSSQWKSRRGGRADELWLWVAVLPDKADRDDDPTVGQCAMLRLTPIRSAASVSLSLLASASSASLQSLSQHTHFEVDSEAQFLSTQRFHATAREIHAVEAIARFASPSSALGGLARRDLPTNLQLISKQDSALGHSILSHTEIRLRAKSLCTESFRMLFFDSIAHCEKEKEEGAKTETKSGGDSSSSGSASTEDTTPERRQLSAFLLDDVVLLSSSAPHNSTSQRDAESAALVDTNGDKGSSSAKRARAAAQQNVFARRGLHVVCGEVSLTALSELQRQLLKESVQLETARFLSLSAPSERESDLAVASCAKSGSVVSLFLLQRNRANTHSHSHSLSHREEEKNAVTQKPTTLTADTPFLDHSDATETMIYTVDIVPDLHFGLGLRLDQSSETHNHQQIVVTSFKKHPITREPMAAELSGLVELGDELVAINDKSYYRQPLSTVIPAIRTILNTLSVGKAVTLKFSREVPVAESPLSPSGSLSSPVSRGLLETSDSSRKNHLVLSPSSVFACSDRFYALPIVTARCVLDVACGGVCVAHRVVVARAFRGLFLVVCTQQKGSSSGLLKARTFKIALTESNTDSAWAWASPQLIDEHSFALSTAGSTPTDIRIDVRSQDLSQDCHEVSFAHVVSIRSAYTKTTDSASLSCHFVLQEHTQDTLQCFFPLKTAPTTAVECSLSHTQIATSAGVSFLKAFALMRTNVFAEQEEPSFPHSREDRVLALAYPEAQVVASSIRFEDDAMALFASVVSPFASRVSDKIHDLLLRVFECAPRGVGARDLLFFDNNDECLDVQDNNFYTSRHGYDSASMVVSSPTYRERGVALDWKTLCERLRVENALLRMSRYLQSKIDAFLRDNAAQFLLSFLYEMHDLFPANNKRNQQRFCIAVGDQLTTRSGLLGLFFVVHSTRRFVEIALACDADLVRRTLTSPVETEAQSETQALSSVLGEFLRLGQFDRFAQSSLWQSLLQGCWIDLVDCSAAALQQIKPDLFAKNKKKALTKNSENDEEDDEDEDEEDADFTLDYNKTLAHSDNNSSASLEPPNHSAISAIQAANMVFSLSQERLFDCFLGCLFPREQDALDQDLARQFAVKFGLNTFNKTAKRVNASGEGPDTQPCDNTSGLAAIDILAYSTNCKVAFWLHDLTPLIDLITRHSLRKFKMYKSSMQIFLEMVLVGKTDTLLQLAKGDSDSTGKQLLKLLLMVDEALNPANTQPDRLQILQNKLRKNAFALIKRHKYREAAATFLLYPSTSLVKSAASVLSQQCDDPLLAHLVTRIFEHRFMHAQPSAQEQSLSLGGKTAYSLSTGLFEASPDFVEHCPFALGAFSRDVVEKDILQRLLRVATDRDTTHFQGNFGFSAAIFSLLCSLWLQDKAVMRSTFAAVFPLILQFLHERESDDEMLSSDSPEHGMLLSCVAQGVKNRYDRPQVDTVFRFLESSVANPFVFHRFAELSASLSFLLDFSQLFLGKGTADKVRDAVEQFLLRHGQHHSHLQFVLEVDRQTEVRKSHAENAFFAHAARWRARGLAAKAALQENEKRKTLVAATERLAAEREAAALAEREKEKDTEKEGAEHRLKFNFSAVNKAASAAPRSMLDDDLPPVATRAKSSARPQRSMLDDDLPPPAARALARPPRSMLDDDVPPPVPAAGATTRPQRSMLDEIDAVPARTAPGEGPGTSPSLSISSQPAAAEGEKETEREGETTEQPRPKFNFSAMTRSTASGAPRSMLDDDLPSAPAINRAAPRPARSMLGDDVPPPVARTAARPQKSMLDDDVAPSAIARTTARPTRSMLDDDLPPSPATRASARPTRSMLDYDVVSPSLSIARAAAEQPSAATESGQTALDALAAGDAATAVQDTTSSETKQKFNFSAMTATRASAAGTAPQRSMLDENFPPAPATKIAVRQTPKSMLDDDVLPASPAARAAPRQAPRSMLDEDVISAAVPATAAVTVNFEKVRAEDAVAVHTTVEGEPVAPEAGPTTSTSPAAVASPASLAHIVKRVEEVKTDPISMARTIIATSAATDSAHSAPQGQTSSSIGAERTTLSVNADDAKKSESESESENESEEESDEDEAARDALASLSEPSSSHGPAAAADKKQVELVSLPAYEHVGTHGTHDTHHKKQATPLRDASPVQPLPITHTAKPLSAEKEKEKERASQAAPLSSHTPSHKAPPANPFALHVPPPPPLSPSPAVSAATVVGISATPDRAAFRSASSSSSTAIGTGSAKAPSFATPARPVYRDAPRDSSAHGKSSAPSNPFAHARPTDTGPASVNAADAERRVLEFYRKHNPVKVSDVPVILAKYKGREGELLSKLQKQYNVSSI